MKTEEGRGDGRRPRWYLKHCFNLLKKMKLCLPGYLQAKTSQSRSETPFLSKKKKKPRK